MAADGRGERACCRAGPGLGRPPERTGVLPQVQKGARQEAHRDKRLLSRTATRSMKEPVAMLGMANAARQVWAGLA